MNDTNDDLALVDPDNSQLVADGLSILAKIIAIELIKDKSISANTEHPTDSHQHSNTPPLNQMKR